MENADMENADTENTDMENADMENANMENADMENADIKNADMENTDMENADMENADMENANMENADMENADIENADKHVKNSCMVDGSACNRFGLPEKFHVSFNIRQNSTKTNSYNNNLIGPLILVAISFDISLINFTIISLSVKVDYICIFLER